MRIGMLNDPRYKFPAEKRKIGGKVYTYLIGGTKAECQADAERFRKQGYTARVVPSLGRKYAVYLRK